MRAKGAERTRPGLPRAGSRGAGPCWVRMPLPSHALISGPRRTSGKFHTLCPCTVRQAGADGGTACQLLRQRRSVESSWGCQPWGPGCKSGQRGTEAIVPTVGTLAASGAPPRLLGRQERAGPCLYACVLFLFWTSVLPRVGRHTAARGNMCGSQACPSPRALRFEPHPPPVKCTVYSPDARGEERASC